MTEGCYSNALFQQKYHPGPLPKNVSKTCSPKSSKIMPTCLPNYPKIEHKLSQEGLKNRLGTHLGKKHGKLDSEHYLPHSRHVGRPPNRHFWEPLGIKSRHKSLTKSSLQKMRPKVRSKSEKCSPRGPQILQTLSKKLRLLFGVCHFCSLSCTKSP